MFIFYVLSCFQGAFFVHGTKVRLICGTAKVFFCAVFGDYWPLSNGKKVAGAYLWGVVRNDMGLFLKALRGALSGVDVALTGGGETLATAPGFFPVGTILGVDEVVDAYTAGTVACVKRCVEYKSGSVASLGFHFMRRKRDGGHVWYEDAEGTPLDRILSQRPNPRQNAYDFLWQIVYQREMYGNAYGVPVYRGGELSALYCIPPDCPVSYDRLRGVYSIHDPYDGIEGEFSESEVIHIRSYCRDGFLGTPVTELAGLVLSNVRKAYKQEGDMFTPGSTLRGFITGEDTVAVGYGGVTDKQLKSVTQRIREAINGGQNLNFLPGSMKFVQTGMTPSDLQLLESMKQLNLEICRFFGVPPTQVFQDSNVNYNTTESSQTIYMTSTLAPLIRQIESEFTEKLFGGNGRYRVRFRLDDYYQTDPVALSGALSSLIQTGAMTPNEARAKMGLPPMDGGDALVANGSIGKLSGPSAASGPVPIPGQDPKQ